MHVRFHGRHVDWDTCEVIGYELANFCEESFGVYLKCWPLVRDGLEMLADIIGTERIKRAVVPEDIYRRGVHIMLLKSIGGQPVGQLLVAAFTPLQDINLCNFESVLLVFPTFSGECSEAPESVVDKVKQVPIICRWPNALASPGERIPIEIEVVSYQRLLSPNQVGKQIIETISVAANQVDGNCTEVWLKDANHNDVLPGAEALLVPIPVISRV